MRTRSRSQRTNGSTSQRRAPWCSFGIPGWGRDGIAGRIDADMALAGRLADLITDATEFELWAPPVTGVVNWRPRRHDPAAVRSRLRRAWVSVAGEPWFRSVAANPLADPDHVLTMVSEALHAN